MYKQIKEYALSESFIKDSQLLPFTAKALYSQSQENVMKQLGLRNLPR